MGQAETAEEALKGEFYDLEFSVQKGRRYHEYLCAFYEGWRDRMKIVTLASGSGAFFLATADFPGFAAVCAAVIALWAALDIVISPDRKARLHSDLLRAYTNLAIKIKTCPQTESSYRDLSAERLRLEHDEPPCKRLIDLVARNDECRAQNFPAAHLVPLSRWQRRLGYYATFGMGRLEEWKARRQDIASGVVDEFDLLS